MYITYILYKTCFCYYLLHTLYLIPAILKYVSSFKQKADIEGARAWLPKWYMITSASFVLKKLHICKTVTTVCVRQSPLKSEYDESMHKVAELKSSSFRVKSNENLLQVQQNGCKWNTLINRNWNLVMYYMRMTKLPLMNSHKFKILSKTF